LRGGGRASQQNGLDQSEQAESLRLTRRDRVLETAKDHAKAIADLIAATGKARAAGK
jgi:hypothetical protein